MNAHSMAQRAYARDSAPIRTDRGAEYDVFARVTHHLKIAEQERNSNFNALARAIHDNRQLWALLAVDVADDGNALPQELRARIFYLAEFTNTFSRRVLTEGASATALVDINTAIMRGLRQEGAPK